MSKISAMIDYLKCTPQPYYSDLGIDPVVRLLAEAEKEQVCPTCGGDKTIIVDNDNMGPSSSAEKYVPCPDCDGEGTYRAWAEKKIADLNKGFEIITHELSLEHANAEMRREEIRLDSKQIADLQAENELLKKGFGPVITAKRGNFIKQLSDKDALIDNLKRLLHYATCAHSGAKHDFTKCQWCQDRETFLAAYGKVKVKDEQ